MASTAFIGTMFAIILFGGIFLLILNVVTSVWAYRDAIRLGRSQEYALIVLVATLFFPIVGFIVYLFIRNN